MQNSVALAEPLLPTEVKQTGVSVAATSTALLMGIVLYPKGDDKDGALLTNYTRINLLDQLKRVEGGGAGPRCDPGTLRPTQGLRERIKGTS